ncbi:MAG: 4-hydroxythreonine-4-phosphate dehydrogenase PdxA [Planctomycetes bacterium]|nr:4-hydroxythreonine-4-phosphate dehydrogenase PdxA [Planctomycetota bacterium]
MNHRPRLLITLGDVAGIGPEVVARAWSELQDICRPIVVGDVGWMQRAVGLTGQKLEVREFDDLEPSRRTMPVIQGAMIDLSTVASGKVSAAAGRAAYEFLCTAIARTLAGQADGIVTLPLNKEGLHAAGLKYPGHTEILAERTGVNDFGMMLYAPPGPTVKNALGVVHVTLHMALRDVFPHITMEAVLEKIHLLNSVMKKLGKGGSPSPPTPLPQGEREEGGSPRLAVCALNPHAGDGGIFGAEEPTIIARAVERAKGEGVHVVGPLPSDTLFVQAAAGRFDGVVAMYHDQGHIPIKLLTGLAAVNVTLGLPIVRTSVAHGTAYDIAGTGIADSQSLVEAARVAALLTSRPIAV